MSAMEKVIAPIAERLREELETYHRTGKFTVPWKISFPYNASTMKEYAGVNILRLAVEGRACPAWATLNQWNKLGYRIDKGSHGCAIYSPSLTSTQEDESTGATRVYSRPPRAYYVFNGEDVTNVETGERFDWQAVNRDERNVDYDDFFSQIPYVVESSDRAFYRPSTDVIHMPPYETFVDSNRYYSTLAHEVIHWTGAKSRLCRPAFAGAKRSLQDSALEELVAEFGSALICAYLNIAYEEVREDHLEYLAGWLEAIKDDDKAVSTAIHYATTAFSHVRSYSAARKEEVTVE